MPPVPIRRLAASLSVVLLLAVSGCGTGGSTSVARDSSVAIAMSEFRLSPQEVEVGAGHVTFAIRNAGTMVHRFEIRSEDGAERVAIGRPLRPGERERITLDLADGEYVIRCAQERHNTLGEHGKLRVYAYADESTGLD